ncbi:MAG: hypothetical protein WBD02_10820, partial [Acidimicrobiia bacterium]
PAGAQPQSGSDSSSSDAPADSSNDSTLPAAPRGALARTGSESTAWLWSGLALLFGGATMVGTSSAARRRLAPLRRR